MAEYPAEGRKGYMQKAQTYSMCRAVNHFKYFECWIKSRLLIIWILVKQSCAGWLWKVELKLQIRFWQTATEVSFWSEFLKSFPKCLVLSSRQNASVLPIGLNNLKKRIAWQLQSLVPFAIALLFWLVRLTADLIAILCLWDNAAAWSSILRLFFYLTSRFYHFQHLNWHVSWEVLLIYRRGNRIGTIRVSSVKPSSIQEYFCFIYE